MCVLKASHLVLFVSKWVIDVLRLLLLLVLMGLMLIIVFIHSTVTFHVDMAGFVVLLLLLLLKELLVGETLLLHGFLLCELSCQDVVLTALLTFLIVTCLFLFHCLETHPFFVAVCLFLVGHL